ncbi:MAG: aminotransferase class I/II-fold pyridoxal phosphate-dependent enzyme [Wenzhouxiangellaceae bacterium]
MTRDTDANLHQLCLKLQQLAEQSSRLQATPTQRADWQQRAEHLVTGYLDDLETRPGNVRPRQRRQVVSGFSEHAQEPTEVFGQLQDCLAADGLRHGSGRLFGFIPGSGNYAGALGDYLAAATNRYTGARFAAPQAAALEQQLLRWLAHELGYPDSARGDLTSGGSIANLTALLCAREQRQLQPDQLPKQVIYLTRQAHHCIAKALHVLGLSHCVLRHIDMDSGWRMSAVILRQQIQQDRRLGFQPWLLIANAGSTDIGAVDPLSDLAEIAHREQLWLHVDGAYGASFALCQTGRAILAGIKHSDSLIVDPHKGLFTPFGSGVVLVRRGAELAAALSASSDYMSDASLLAEGVELDAHQLSLELSRHFRGLRLWLSLQLHGLAAFRAALEEKLLLARYAWEKLQQMPGFATVGKPDLSIVGLFADIGTDQHDDFNRRLLDAVQDEGEVFLTSTRLHGRLVIRLAVMAQNSHREHVDLALERLAWHRQRLLR